MSELSNGVERGGLKNGANAGMLPVPDNLKYAGIQRPHELGRFGVEENAKRLRRYEFLHRQLALIQSFHLPQRALWELKTAIGKHLYEDSEAAASLQERILQLRQPRRSLNSDPDQRLRLFVEELLRARNDAELLVGIYEILKPRMLAAYKAHLQETQQIVDQPTIRLLRQIVNDLEEQLEWGREAIRFFVDEAGKREHTREFEKALRRFLTAAGGVTGEEEGAGAVPLRRWRSLEGVNLPTRSVRDRRFPGTVHYRAGASDDAQDEVTRKLYHMMRVRQEEMTAAELIAAVIWENRHKEWEMIRDLARHLWDEIRHSMFGQAACEAEGIDWAKYPQYTSDYDLNITNLPASQYAWLAIGIEGGAMKRGGKKAEYEFCRDEAQHPLMAQFQDYDWADEVVHAQFGRKWGTSLFDGDEMQARRAAEQALDEFWAAVRKAEEERPEPVWTDFEP